MALDFRKLSPNLLDAFIADHLQPDEKFHDLASSALDTLCRYLECQMRPNVKRIVKSGSLGKGTALKNLSDLDCILIMNGIIDATQLKANIETVLAQIRTYLQRPRWHDWRVTVTIVNEYLVSFEMTSIYYRKSLKVDLLPTFDANVRCGQSRQELYLSMASCDETTKSYCSAALAELQRDFVKERPTKLKSLIRLVKHWAKAYVINESRSKRMPSYVIELVTIYCWEQDGSTNCFNTADLFRAIMVALSKHAELNIQWQRYYSLNRCQSTTSLPKILDPANPYNNLYNDVNCWDTVKQVALQTLRMP